MAVNFRKILTPSAMRFDLATQPLPPGQGDEDPAPDDRRNLDRVREEVVGELCDLLESTGEVSSRNRLFRDLHNREKRAPTAIGQGIALPHVRTIQAKSLVMAFARSREGLPFDAVDDEPVRLFFAMVAPPYDDRLYLKIYKSLASSLLQPECLETLLEAESPNDVWEILERFR